MLEEERETEREEAAELEVGETLPVPGEQVGYPFRSFYYIFYVIPEVFLIHR